MAFYRTTDLVGGRWDEAFRTDVSSLGEPQGEGVTFAGNDTVILVGEAGGLRGAGTFARLACTSSPDRRDLADRELVSFVSFVTWRVSERGWWQTAPD